MTKSRRTRTHRKPSPRQGESHCPPSPTPAASSLGPTCRRRRRERAQHEWGPAPAKTCEPKEPNGLTTHCPISHVEQCANTHLAQTHMQSNRLHTTCVFNNQQHVYLKLVSTRTHSWKGQTRMRGNLSMMIVQHQSMKIVAILKHQQHVNLNVA